MRKMIFWGLIILAVVYWQEISNFVSGNVGQVNISITQWLVDHTPKK